LGKAYRGNFIFVLNTQEEERKLKETQDYNEKKNV